MALVSNAISKGHQTHLADGGYGFLLGDGALNYGRENILAKSATPGQELVRRFAALRAFGPDDLGVFLAGRRDPGTFPVYVLRG